MFQKIQSYRIKCIEPLNFLASLINLTSLTLDFRYFFNIFIKKKTALASIFYYYFTINNKQSNEMGSFESLKVLGTLLNLTSLTLSLRYLFNILDYRKKPFIQACFFYY